MDVLAKVEQICVRAGEAVMEVYRRPIADAGIQNKSDNTPVTEADLAANAIIEAELRQLLPGVPIISEESPLPSYAERRQWDRFWLVDPVDGTKEFISGNGEFTVNVALIEQGTAILGVVYAPAIDTLYSGAQGFGAWKRLANMKVAIQPRNIQSVIANSLPLLVVGSRMYGIPELPAALLDSFSSIECKTIGSSLKFCLVAEGAADFYPRYAPTKEWDTAAAQAILEAAGGVALSSAFTPIGYNTETLVNPYFYVFGDKSYDWRGLLG